MIIVGVDPSFTATGLVVLKDDDFLYAELSSRQKDGEKKVFQSEIMTTSDLFCGLNKHTEVDKVSIVIEKDQLCLEVIRYYDLLYSMFCRVIEFSKVGTDDEIYIGIEVPFGYRTGQSIKSDRAFALSVVACAHSMTAFLSPGCRFYISTFSPTQVKKFVTGKGNASKQVVMMSVFKKWNFETDSFDLSDAYGIARYAHHTAMEDRNARDGIGKTAEKDSPNCLRKDRGTRGGKSGEKAGRASFRRAVKRLIAKAK